MRRAIPLLAILVLAGFALAQTDTLHFEGFEGATDWEFGDLYWYGDTLTYWHTDSFHSYDGSSYWCGTRDVGGTGFDGYNDGWLQYMDFGPATIPSSAATATLSFKHILNTEPAGSSGWPYGFDGWDGAALWISTDAGASWDVLDPSTPAYDCNSLWGFGFCGLGAGYPAWTGIHGSVGSFEDATANLSSFAGEDVWVRFVFSSDMMFSTGPTHADAPSFDSTMFGWVVDEVTLTADADTLIYASAAREPEVSQGRKLQTFEVVESDAYSGTHSAMTRNYSEVYNTLTSPLLSVPDTFAGDLNFAVKLGFATFDPDSDSSLDDYFMVNIIDSTADTTMQLFYDYYRPGTVDESWTWMEEGLLFNGSTSIRDYAGHDIRVQILSRGDGFPDTSQYLYIDDITISGRYAPLHDLNPDYIAAGPLVYGEFGRFTAVIANDGMSRESLVEVMGKIEYPDGSDTTLNFFPRPTIDGGKEGTAVVQLRLDQAGEYTVTAWTSLSTDMDMSNDTVVATFDVPEADTREMGWDDGVNDVASDPTSGTTYNGFLGPSLHAGDCLGNYFDDTGDLTDLELPKISFFTRFSGPVRVLVMDNGFFDIPNGGTELLDTNVTVAPEDTIDGSWVDVEFETPLDLPDSNFFVFVGTAVDSQMPAVGIDNTTPVERWGFAIISYYDTTGTFLGVDTMALRDASAPLNAIDLMIRAVVTGVTGIDEDGRLPAKLALHENHPNPFNPTTAIGFDLPSQSRVELSVYNMLGERVTTLVDNDLSAGTHRVIWEGRDDHGREVPSGLYLYKLSAEDRVITKKMILMK